MSDSILDYLAPYPDARRKLTRERLELARALAEMRREILQLQGALVARMERCSIEDNCGSNPETWTDDTVVCGQCLSDYDLIKGGNMSGETREELEREIERLIQDKADLESCIERAANELRCDNPDEALRCLEGRWR